MTNHRMKTTAASSEPSALPAKNSRLLSKLSSLVESYTREHQTKSAVFWAGQRVTLSGGDSEAVLQLAEALYRDGQFLRAAHTLKARQLDRADVKCCYLAARATLEAGEAEDALQVLLDGEDAIKAAATKVEENPKGEDDMRHVSEKH